MSGFMFAQRAHVLALADQDLFVREPIIDGMPWPELVHAVDPQRGEVLGLAEKGLFLDGPIIDGIPWPELVHDFNVFG